MPAGASALDAFCALSRNCAFSTYDGEICVVHWPVGVTPMTGRRKKPLTPSQMRSIGWVRASARCGARSSSAL